jgi:lipopolysaccharide transport system permease protein
MSTALIRDSFSRLRRPLEVLSPRQNIACIAEVLRHVASMRDLLTELIRREINSPHAGHGLGPAWAYIHPIVIVLVYLYVIGFVIGSKIDASANFPGDYPSYILVGLVPWLMTQNALVRTTGALTANSNLVKQVVFPIEILPVAAFASASIPYLPALTLVLCYQLYVSGGLPATTLLLPAVFAMHIALGVGLGFALSALSVFVRDLREIVSVFCVVAMYVTPAIYLPEWVPAKIRPILYLNPFSYVTWCYQDAIFFGAIKHPVAWVVFAALAFISLALGYRLFRELKPFYGNVL